MEDVGTTKRKPLTPTQRLKMFEAHKGVCCICNQQIKAGEKWLDEHIRPLGLGGSNDLTNRAPAHVVCAAGKTFGKDGDNARIAKAKRVKMRHLGISKSKQKIQSRGFSKAPREPKTVTKIVPRKEMFTD